jgi:3-oxoacyl-[acyl-carrier protein] reductase
MTTETRVALITGASRGIGRAIAHELGRQGRIVIGTATSDAGAERIDADLKAQGIEGAGRRLDVTDQASVDALVKAITEEFGAPTILVNNAGITRDNLLMRMKEDEWDAVVDTNLKSVYRVSKACLRA